MSLVFNHEGRLCLRFFRRVDGTILTSDCPVGLQAIRRRAARIVASIVTMLATLSFGSWFVQRARAQPNDSAVQNPPGPLARLIDWIDPPDVFILGALALPHITIDEEDESLLNTP